MAAQKDMTLQTNLHPFPLYFSIHFIRFMASTLMAGLFFSTKKFFDLTQGSEVRGVPLASPQLPKVVKIVLRDFKGLGRTRNGQYQNKSFTTFVNGGGSKRQITKQTYF